MRTCNLFLAVMLTAALPVCALVNSGNPGGNRTAPTGLNGEPADPGFDRVGFNGSASGVYLGEGWVLTARHLPAKTFTLDGVTYEWDGVNDYKFPDTELRLFRLANAPEMPVLPMISQTPRPGENVIMVGAGRDCEDHVTYWYVDKTAQPITWTEVPTRGEANAGGVLSNEGSIISWGTNLVSNVMPHPKLGALIITDFTENPATRTTFEAQAVSYDNGGALFTETNGEWKLAGIMITVSKLFPEQPGVNKEPGGPKTIGSGVFGNVTISINLAPYSHRILQVMANSKPAPQFAEMQPRPEMNMN
ncbi:hypothetical protein [Ruficoccus sp. ZRK36]|uniref:hypothetical protein n=1 Tax=Ruficoccus sp. ZRK36 TaxID=2866311 RepID=UPI001C736224|nr:hypothetical protein [Ruficoccus sp. ZRK36]QYY36118.1 hypothetical protein K0V07_01295 [Ruficoccus sp. ZRK36]